MIWLTSLMTPTLSPVTCPDEITGTWVGTEARPRGWLRYTVTIETTSTPGAITGKIEGHFWATNDPAPPPCGVHDEVVAHQPAQGTFDGAAVVFEADRVARREKRCGRPGQYNPDRIWGALRRHSILDVTSDDGRTGPGPVVLTRVACGTGASSPPSS